MGVAIRRLADFIREDLNISLYLGRIKFSADKPFDRKDCIFRIGHSLPLGGLANQPLSAVSKGYNRGSGPASLCIGDHHRIPALHNGDTRIGCPEIDSYCFSHIYCLLISENFLEI